MLQMNKELPGACCCLLCQCPSSAESARNHCTCLLENLRTHLNSGLSTLHTLEFSPGLSQSSMLGVLCTFPSPLLALNRPIPSSFHSRGPLGQLLDGLCLSRYMKTSSGQRTKENPLLLNFFSRKYHGSLIPLFSALKSQDMNLPILPKESCPRA